MKIGWGKREGDLNSSPFFSAHVSCSHLEASPVWFTVKLVGLNCACSSGGLWVKAPEMHLRWTLKRIQSHVMVKSLNFIELSSYVI